jgi:carbon-monoxide dehydrogenase small subunit
MTAELADGGPTVPLEFTLNGAKARLEVPTNLTLADLLREHFALKGTRLACARAVCGACTVLIDGRPAASCATFAFEIDGAEIMTIEGLESPDGTLDPIQEAFAANSAFQCGYCTSGMILLAKALLACCPDPDQATIVKWISSNICRCMSYTLIVEAVQDAVRRQHASRKDGAA